MFSVLYLDDDPALLDLAKIFLEMSGKLRIDTAHSVGEALDKTQHRNYDGIISDYEMPSINGIEFLRHIRLSHPDLPFVLFTGRGREEIAIEALNNGADFYLQKGGPPKSQFAELEFNLIHAIDRKRVRDDLKESRQMMANLIDFLPGCNVCHQSREQGDLLEPDDGETDRDTCQCYFGNRKLCAGPLTV